MHLANGGFLPWFIAGFVLLSVLVLLSQAKRESILSAFFTPSAKNTALSHFDVRARRIRIALLLGALFFIGFAALDPRWGSRRIENQLEGIDAVFLMDVSESMRTPDVVPDRLENAKKLAIQLMSLLTGNRIGLAAFAGYGFQVSPLTTDADAVTMFLSELTPDMVDVQGSNIEDAIRKALALFQKNALTHKAIILFTDGEDTEFKPMDAAKEARDQGVSLYTVGVGTRNGLPVPLFDENGNLTNYQVNSDGHQVISRLNEQLLSDIASVTGGASYPGTPGGMIDLANKLDAMNKARFGANVYEFMEPQYQYFLGIGILLLLLSSLLPERRLKFPTAKTAPLLLLALLLAAPSGLHASDASRASSDWKKGDYDSALRGFQKSLVQDPKNEKLLFNQGNALLGLTNFDSAAASYAQLTNSADPDIRWRSAYNLGASYLDKKDFGNAIEQYGRILTEAPEKSPYYRNSLLNFLYAKEQMKEQQKQQKQNGNSGQDNKDQKNQQTGNDKKDQKQNQKQDQQKSDQAMKPISPTEAENLLNLIAQEEKKHFGRKEVRSGTRVNPKNPW
jgi:Ca-activated chloride channel family protein